MDTIETLNLDYLDAQYERWKNDPASVSRDWQAFFKGFDIAGRGGRAAEGAVDFDQVLKQSRVEALKYRYRDLGHLLSCMDPLTACPTSHPLLDIEHFGLSLEDFDREFYTRRFSRDSRAPLKQIVQHLKETYCRSVGIEYMHLQDPDERKWLQDRMEPVRNRPELEAGQQTRIFELLARSALFEQFLNKKFVGVTRFSLEGGDAIVPMLDALVQRVAGAGVEEIILGMAHRGRLNIQAHILGKPYEEIFAEFENCYDPGDLVGSGDVKYHNGYLADVKIDADQRLRIYLVNNPSHLEAVDPVVEGFARARQEILGDDGHRRVLPLLLHGDAAFAGQGVVMETLNMSQLEGYRTGGTIHIVINNQIGYTTLPKDARSTRYSTDVAKMIMVPIFHVHGEDPQAVVHVARLAAEYRMAFQKDVVIDVICYRRYGHNEGDEPYFTQPQMYDRIRERPSLHRMFADRLLEEGGIDEDKIRQSEEKINGELEAAYDEVHGTACPFPELKFFENWDGYHGSYSHEMPQTGVEKERLVEWARRLATVPSDFKIFSKLEKLLQKRLESVENGEGIDWANAEALAWASLLAEGHPVRLSGQDCGRGTFSQRHSVLIDTETGRDYVPLNNLEESQALYKVYNSLLSEYGVLGFEYGYATAQPKGLVLWEAQFGDFANNAQSVIDLFIASGEAKWQRLSGLGMLLPHGWEGLGPEHSSARLERFLQLCANDNMQVVNPTTPAQYFHLMRCQALRKIRKPLVVMTPKSLLRHPRAVSTLDALAEGSFQEVIGDPEVKKPRRVLLCSGKLYYALDQRRQEREETKTAIVRLEQFFPFPADALAEALEGYADAKEWFWVQEEPENMGGWQFVHRRIAERIDRPLSCIGRPASASPATGFPAIYKEQQEKVIRDAVGPKPKEGQVS
jgi:2-oxoglutarate dehydrogenase E1 component